MELGKIVDQMVSSLLIGADEPGRDAAARCQLKVQREHNACDPLPNLQIDLFIGGECRMTSPRSPISNSAFTGPGHPGLQSTFSPWPVH